MFRFAQPIRFSHCDPMVPPHDLRAPSLAIDAEFVRACVLGETLDFDLWTKRLGKSSFDLALTLIWVKYPRSRLPTLR